MGGIVGGITDAIGLTNHKGEKQAAAAAAEANAAGIAMSKEQIELAKEQLTFSREQYQDWKNIYGDIQKNLGDYYNSLDPDKLVALGLENQQREFQVVDKALKRDFAQRGLTNSGAEITQSAISSVQNATARAAIRTNANELVAQQKLGFLGVGLNQGTAMLGNTTNAASNVTSAFSSAVNSRNQATNSYLGRANALGVQNLQNMNDVMGTVAGAFKPV